MESYILKSTACLLVFLLFYKLVLEKEKMHKFNRFYLLGALALSFGIPLVTFTKIVEIEQIPYQPMQEIFQFSPLSTETVVTAETVNYLSLILIVIYSIGFLIFLGVFIKNLIKLNAKIRKNEKLRKEHSVQVLLQKNTIPHTFLKYIFLNKKALENQEIPAEVLLHEEAHVQQKHSLDILFVEFLKVIFWFNPLIYFIRHSIKMNHEFLADDAVLQNNVDASFYKKILLEFSLPNNNQSEPTLANSINYSSIKKRFTVMKKHTSKKSVWLRSLLFLPLIAALVYGFSEKKETIKYLSNDETNQIEQNPANSFKIVIKQTEKGVWLKCEEGCAWVDLKFDLSTSQAIDEYGMTQLDQDIDKKDANLSDFLLLVTKTDGKFVIKGIEGTNWTDLSFSVPKDGRQMINQSGMISPNTGLINLEEGATEKMMQEYRDYIKKYQSVEKRILEISKHNRIKDIYDLMTTEQKASVINHNTIFRAVNFDFPTPKRKKPSQTEFNSWKNSKKFAVWIDNKHIPNSELDKYSTEDFVYFNGSFVYKNARSTKFPQEYQYHLYTEQGFESTYLKSDVNKYNNLLNKYTKARNEFLSSGSTDNSELRLLHARLWKMHEQFTPNEIEKYKVTTPEPYPYYKTEAEKQREKDLEGIEIYEDKNQHLAQQDSVKFIKDWFITIEGKKYYYVRNKDKSWTYYDSNKKAIQLDIVSEYKKKTNILETLRRTGKHYIHKAEKDQKIMDMQFSDLGGMYFRMPRANKNKVKRPKSPYAPYIRYERDGKVIYKKKEDLTEDDKAYLAKKYPMLPPPPIPADATPEQRKKYQSRIDKYNKKYPEKVKKGEKSNIPPPPPPITISKSNSPEIVKAKETFFKNSDLYGKAVNLYRKNGEGSREELEKLYEGVMTDYNEYNKLSSTKIPPPPPPSPKVKKGEKSNIPPPPPPIKSKDKAQNDQKTGWLQINNEKHYYITDANGNTKYFNRWGVQVNKNGKSLNSGNTDKPRKVAVIPPEDMEPPVAESDNNPIFINGLPNKKVSLSQKEIQDLILTAEFGHVTSFKFKIPGKPSVLILGSRLYPNTKELISELNEKSSIMIFDIKTIYKHRKPSSIFITVKS